VITILASPKPFVGIAWSQQRRAIRSWLALAPDIEVILFGDAEGAADAARELGVQHVADVERSEYGTPYFGAIAAYGERHGRYDLQMYINCDILTTSTLAAAAARAPFAQFLMVGQRVELAPTAEIDPTEEAWESQALDLARRELVEIAPATACDYFIFRRGIWRDLPPTIIGRAAYDNALIAHCLRNSVPVIDATQDVLVFHPFHHYGHVAGGKKTVWQGEEARLNLESIGPCPAPGTWDATWRCENGAFSRSWGHGDWLRAAEIRARLVCRSPRMGLLLGVCGRWARKLGLSRAKPVKLEPMLYRLLKGA
jgi:hypothetical protein